MKLNKFHLQISLSKDILMRVQDFFQKNILVILLIILSLLSASSWYIYFQNGLGLSYNDARSHLDIGRRVVEGLKPGLAQIGSVWLPLPHLLMIPTIWSDFMWHSGLAGAIQSMISFVATSILVYLFLKELGTSLFVRVFGVLLFIANINILYLQSTAMTELLLLFTMTAASYFLLRWAKTDSLFELLKSSFFVMLSTLIRYDGWFLIFATSLIVIIDSWRKKGFKKAEGVGLLFMTLGGLGIILWLLWNALIFKDPLYFAFGSFSAYAQQEQLLEAGNLPTKGDVILSTKIYLHALAYNSYTIPALFALVGIFVFWMNKKYTLSVKIASLALIAPLVFNILALYLGHSVLFIQGISGNTWFNVRYGVMLAPTIAIFTGLLVERFSKLRNVIVGISLFVLFLGIVNKDAVTIDDATVGSSQKNVSEVSGYLHTHAKNEKEFILISAASHDAIIFSSGLPMKRFIHEGTGLYWESAIKNPDRWARWIVLRTYDKNDMTYREIYETEGFTRYDLVESYPFADVYELKEEYRGTLISEPIYSKQ